MSRARAYAPSSSGTKRRAFAPTPRKQFRARMMTKKEQELKVLPPHKQKKKMAKMKYVFFLLPLQNNKRRNCIG